MWMHSSTYGTPIGILITNEVSDTQLLEVEAALTNVFRSTAFKWITFYFHYLYRECTRKKNISAEHCNQRATETITICI